jgi:hypothetical protein
MRFYVKPHSGILSFFWPKRGPSTRTIGFLPAPPCFLCLGILSAPPLSPQLVVGESGGAERMPVLAVASARGSLLAKALLSAGVFYGPDEKRPDNRLSV